MAYRLLKHNYSAFPSRINVARYHDYVRVAVPGSSLSNLLVYNVSIFDVGGTARIPLVSPKVIGVANSRGNRS
jgi:protein phosphatase PTC6